MNYGIYVGGGKLDAEGIQSIADVVLQILESPYNDQATKQLALQIVNKACETTEAPNHLNFSGINVTMSHASTAPIDMPDEEDYPYDDENYELDEEIQ